MVEKLKDGYISLPNAFYEALYQSGLNKTELLVCLVVSRHTHGYHREIWETTKSYISKLSGIDAGDIGKAMKALNQRHILKMGHSNKFRVAVAFYPVGEWLEPSKTHKRQKKNNNSDLKDQRRKEAEEQERQRIADEQEQLRKAVQHVEVLANSSDWGG